MRDFRTLEIWKRSYSLVKNVYKLTNQLPSKELYGLVSQINRASVSIPSNIAEGCGRRTNADLSRLIDIAVGSSFEVETQLMLVADIYKIKGTVVLIKELNELQKMMNSYKKYLKNNPNT